MCWKRKVKYNEIIDYNDPSIQRKVECKVDDLNKLIKAAVEYGKNPCVDTEQHFKLCTAMCAFTLSDLLFMHFNVMPDVKAETPQFIIQGYGKGIFH